MQNSLIMFKNQKGFDLPLDTRLKRQSANDKTNKIVRSRRF